MAESLLQELKRYVGFEATDEEALRAFHPLAAPHFVRIAEIFYRRILDHQEARKALEGGESQVGRLKATLRSWMDRLLSGPWDADYFQARAKIGRVHVRIGLHQHYMFGAMNVLRGELNDVIHESYSSEVEQLRIARRALGKILDIELAIMLHTFREDEKRDLTRRAAVAEKLAAVGTLTAGLSHEIRNPLNAASLQLMVLERRLRRMSVSEQDPLLGPLRLVQEEIQRLEHILQDFLQFARPREIVARSIELAPLVERVLDLLAGEAERRGVRFDLAFDARPTVSGDPDLMRQVVMNLTLNAMEAVGSGGRVLLGISSAEDEFLLTVDDNGPGIPASMMDRLFEPFFTTKAQGSGLGLPIVNALVSQHGGSIDVGTSTLGGARFTVHLPDALSQIPAASSRQPPNSS